MCGTDWRCGCGAVINIGFYKLGHKSRVIVDGRFRIGHIFCPFTFVAARSAGISPGVLTHVGTGGGTGDCNRRCLARGCRRLRNARVRATPFAIFCLVRFDLLNFPHLFVLVGLGVTTLSWRSGCG